MADRDTRTEEEQQPGRRDDEAAQAEVDALEDDPPQDLQDWPDGDAKYKTFGGPEGDTGYEEGATAKLGDADVRHHEDGSVTVGGEKVDNPDDYKGEPIPGGPTDPNTPSISGEQDLTEGGREEEGEQGDPEDERS